MVVYLDLVVLLNFLVDALLLTGANRLTGHPSSWRRCTLAAAVGGIYAGLCMIPECRFLGNLLWRMVSLGAMVVIAYGCNGSALRRGMIFVLLSMALGGIALGMGSGNFFSIVLAATVVALLGAIGLKMPLGAQKYQPVELSWRGQKIKLTALIDTGNTLRDPITGGSVLVVGMDVGRKLGFSREAICDPIAVLAANPIPGARLIPYRAVGRSGGMLLMVRLEEVRLNGQVISPMVAFAPDEIGRNGEYQALAGGIV